MESKKVMNYAFLIGSGFSVPKGLPKVGDINKRFTTLVQSDIFIGSDMKAFFLNGKSDPNGRIYKIEKDFFVEFIADYCKQIGGVSEFNYEGFFDYYFSYHRGDENSNIEVFCDSFRIKHGKKKQGIDDNANLLLRFNSTFTQLLSSLLQKKEFYENGVHKIDYPPYDEFIRYLNSITQKDENVNIHTLNHDILFEHLCTNTDLSSKFCDGYTEKGSPYYGDLEIKNTINKTYKVRLKYFNNEYPKPIKLYKLHGSIDVYSFKLVEPNFDKTRIKTDYGISDFYKEIENSKTNKKEYINGYSGNYPDFLSGTTEKLRSYDNNYYEIIFDHFKSNLQKADKLIIIGYGFWDTGINKILLDHYISKGKEPIVIDPYKPSSPFYTENKFKHLEKSISDMTISEFEKL